MPGTNILTQIAPTLYSAAQEVSNEPFGIVDSIFTSFDNKGVAKGDKVKVPVAPIRAADDFSPSNVSSTGDGATADAVEVEITKSRLVSFNLTGEQLRSLENGGNDQEWIRQLLAQGMRTLRNEAEADAAVAVKLGASRAVGIVGQNPFASDLNGLVDLRKILRDNGAPMSDLQFVGDSNAETSMLKLGIVQQAFAAGSDAERRQGQIFRQFGFRINTSAGIAQHTSGAAGSYVTNGTQNVRSTGVVVATGTAPILAGDVFTMANSGGFQYVVNSALTGAGTLAINRPGLRQQVATGQALTFTANYTPSLGFERNAVVGIMRPPIVPANPTINQLLISDGRGMTYLLLDIAQYGQRTWELHLAWGFKVVQPEHVAMLIQ
jgi:hypothetical protein